MSLTIETGAGVTGADSYVDLAYCETYLANVGYTIWAPLLDDEKEAALRMAARYLDAKSYSGQRIIYTQAMAWPRSYALFDQNFEIPSSVIPENLKRAQCEAAIRAAQGTLTADNAGGYVIEETVGGITKRYSDYSKSTTKAMTVVDDLLRPLLSSSGSSHRVMRG
jgi:hypothetical protein